MAYKGSSLPEESGLLRANRRQALLFLIEKFGTIRALAEATDTDPVHLSQIKNGTREMGEAVAGRIERALELPPNSMGNRGPLPFSVREPGTTYQARGEDVPVVGTVQAGDEGYWNELQYPVGHGDGFIRCPSKDPNAYALRVKGDSMRPRIKPGEFILVEPAGAIVAGDEVLIATTDGRSMVKLLGPRRDGMVELYSINEQHRPITIEESEIRSMHLVAAIVKPSRYFRER